MTKIKDFFQQIGSLAVTILIILVIIFIIFNIYKSIMRNHQINEQISSLETEIEEIKKKNNYLENLIIYYNTDTFRELELRRKLGMKKVDERVVIIPENKSSNGKNELGLPTYEDKKEERQDPNYLKWWRYITGK